MEPTDAAHVPLEADQSAKDAALVVPVIRVKGHVPNSKSIEKRLNFLWNSCHALLHHHQSALAHQLCHQLVHLAQSHRVVLPFQVLQFVCERCHALLLPQISCSIQVKHYAHNSRIRRKVARKLSVFGSSSAGRDPHHQTFSSAPSKPSQQRAKFHENLRNIVRVKCLRCEHVNLHVGAVQISKESAVKKPKRSRDEALEDVPLASSHDQKRMKQGKYGRYFVGGEASEQHQQHQKETNKRDPRGLGFPDQKPAAPVMNKPKSVFDPPPSPPRKLLEVGKRKKKKKQPQAAQQAAVKSKLSSFLSSLRPGTSS